MFNNNSRLVFREAPSGSTFCAFWVTWSSAGFFMASLEAQCVPQSHENKKQNVLHWSYRSSRRHHSEAQNLPKTPTGAPEPTKDPQMRLPRYCSKWFAVLCGIAYLLPSTLYLYWVLCVGAEKNRGRATSCPQILIYIYTYICIWNIACPQMCDPEGDLIRYWVPWCPPRPDYKTSRSELQYSLGQHWIWMHGYVWTCMHIHAHPCISMHMHV